MLDLSRFSLNRIIYPGLDLENFFKLTQELGLSKVELRNDLPGGKILDDASPEAVKALADRYGIEIITINAIQHFNLGSVLSQVYEETRAMLNTASAIGCGAVVICPHNDYGDR